MNDNNQKCQATIDQLGLHPRIVQHEPILNFETAEKVDQELGLTGTETKSMFLKGKSGKHYLFITTSDQRMDQKALRQILGVKVKLVTGDEMIELTKMQPGCMTPFGLPDGLISAIVVDPVIYQHSKLILAFGSECMSMEITADELRQLLDHLYPDNTHYLG